MSAAPRHRHHPSRRSERRFFIPINGMASVRARLELEGKRIYQGLLWDLSRSGACLFLHDVLQLPQEPVFTLRLQSAHGQQDLALNSEVRWSQNEAGHTFVGLRFQDGPLPVGTFLEPHLAQA